MNQRIAFLMLILILSSLTLFRSDSGRTEGESSDISETVMRWQWPFGLTTDEFVVIDTATVEKGKILFVVPGRDFLEDDTLPRCLSAYRKPQETLPKVAVLWIPKGGLGQEAGAKIVPRDYVAVFYQYDLLEGRPVMSLYYDEITVIWYVQPRAEFVALRDSVRKIFFATFVSNSK